MRAGHPYYYGDRVRWNGSVVPPLLDRLRRLLDGMKRRERAVGSLMGSNALEQPADQPPVRPERSVAEFLDAREGWAWQTEVQGGLGWSAGKTSEVLSDMERRGLVVRHRVGHAKIVCLPERDRARADARR